MAKVNTEALQEEISLPGGRTTLGVVRKGETVHRPQCKNSGMVHQVLEFLKEQNIDFVPQFLGIDEQNREVISLLPGSCPDNIGFYSHEQIAVAMDRIRTLHQVLKDFPGCAPGQTVCHYDLSPCNFLFAGEQPKRQGEMKISGLPIYIIDWDACNIGDPLDDLAYAVWLWLDLGNEEFSASMQANRIRMMLDRYGVTKQERPSFLIRIDTQMKRVGNSVFPREEQTIACRNWVNHCRSWLQKYESELGF